MDTDYNAFNNNCEHLGTKGILPAVNDLRDDEKNTNCAL